MLSVRCDQHYRKMADGRAEVLHSESRCSESRYWESRFADSKSQWGNVRRRHRGGFGVTPSPRACGEGWGEVAQHLARSLRVAAPHPNLLPVRRLRRRKNGEKEPPAFVARTAAHSEEP